MHVKRVPIDAKDELKKKVFQSKTRFYADWGIGVGVGSNVAGARGRVKRVPIDAKGELKKRLIS